MPSRAASCSPSGPSCHAFRRLDRNPPSNHCAGIPFSVTSSGQRAEVLIPLVARVPIQEGAGDRMAGHAVVDTAAGGCLLHHRIIRRECPHGGRAVPVRETLAPGKRSESAGTLADEEAPYWHWPHERLDGPNHARQVLQHSALEDLGVEPIRCGETLRDGRAEHDVFAGGRQ